MHDADGPFFVGEYDAVGLYGGELEPALGVSVSFQERDRVKVLAALERFAQNFNQEQVHIRRDPDRRTKVGHVYEDGSYNAAVVRWDLTAPMTRDEVQAVIDASGLFGLTVTDTYLEAYYFGDPTDADAREEWFAATQKARQELGGAVQGVRRGHARLWAYGTGFGATGAWPASGDFRPPPGAGDQASGAAQRIASRLAARIVHGTTQAYKTTKRQAAVQRRIAEAYDALLTDNLSDDDVRRAYEELAVEVRAQFDAMPIRVEVWRGKGKPYHRNGKIASRFMRRDILFNNHLYIEKTTDGAFDAAHPLFADSAREALRYDEDGKLEVDAKGKPIVDELLFIDLLHAVRDYYGHTMSPTKFGPRGMEATWRNHMAMTTSPWARWALTTELRGQNSWTNFREGAEEIERLRDRPLAEQKADLLPLEFVMTGDPDIDAALAELPGSEGLALEPDIRSAARVQRIARALSGQMEPFDRSYLASWLGSPLGALPMAMPPIGRPA